ncbi:MAG: hypothetical protein ACI8P9_004829 [Parasphingorhabdus sp.]
MARNQRKRSNNVSYSWPVPILTKKFGQYQKVNAELIPLFYEYKKAHPRNSGSVYSSPDTLTEEITHPAMQQLSRFITDGVFELAAEVNGDYWKKAQNININVTGIWFQITNDFGFHETHIHGNCSWSGVYYVQAGQSSSGPDSVTDSGMPNGITRFYGPHMEYAAGGHGDLGNLYLQDHTLDSYPEDGKLVIFPAHLKHMVFPYQGVDDRIIVSFHAQVLGDTELRYDYGFS